MQKNTYPYGNTIWQVHVVYIVHFTNIYIFFLQIKIRMQLAERSVKT